MTSSERENQTNSGWFHHWTEGVMIIKARALMKTPWKPVELCTCP